MEKNNNMVFLSLGIIAVLLLGVFSANLLLADKTPSTINVVTGTADELARTLSANGTVEKMVAPDQVEIYLAVETLDKSATVSQTENATITESVINALKTAGVTAKEIQTTNYSVQEQWEWNGTLQKSVSVGYKTTNAIKVTLKDLTKTGTITDVAVSAGANRVDAISFTLSKEKQEAEKQIALTEAAQAAKIKATAIASGLGVELGNIKTVTESYNYYTPNYRMYDTVMSDGAEKSTTSISPSDVSISANVSVTYELK